MTSTFYSNLLFFTLHSNTNSYFTNNGQLPVKRIGGRKDRWVNGCMVGWLEEKTCKRTGSCCYYWWPMLLWTDAKYNPQKCVLLNVNIISPRTCSYVTSSATKLLHIFSQNLKNISKLFWNWCKKYWKILLATFRRNIQNLNDYLVSTISFPF